MEGSHSGGSNTALGTPETQSIMNKSDENSDLNSVSVASVSDSATIDHYKFRDSESSPEIDQTSGSRPSSSHDVLHSIFHVPETKDEDTLIYEAEKIIAGKEKHLNQGSVHDDIQTVHKLIDTSLPSGKGESDDSMDSPELSSRRYSTRRVWWTMLLILVCYLSTMISLVPICTQYFPARIARDKYNITVNSSDTSSTCKNSTDTGETLYNEVQADAANVILMATIAGGIPAIIMCLFVGSYADYLGRRPLVIMSLMGLFFRVGSLGVICSLDVSIYLYIAGSALDGLGGSLYTMILAFSAVISDLTQDIHSRAVKFAVLEGTVMVSGALAQLLVGVLIKETGFLVPILMFAILVLLALVLAVFGLPETMPVRRAMNWNILQHMRKVFGFYFLDGTRARRGHFGLGLLIFGTVSLTVMGRHNVETLFMQNHPICWKSMDIGIFNSVRLILMSVIAVITIKLLKRRLSLEVIGMIAIVSGTAGFVFESLATDTATMYLSALVAILYMTVNPIPRALLSQIASPVEQGALFSSFSVIEVVATIASSTMATVIYNSTLDTFKGAVFLVFAGICLVAFFLLLAYRLLRRAYPHVTEHVILPPGAKSDGKDTSQKTGTSHKMKVNDNDSESTPLLKA